VLELVTRPSPDVEVWAFGRESTVTLVSVYAMRMAAVFTLSVSTVGLRTRAIPRWVAYLGLAVALVLMVAAGEHRWSQLIFPAWVLVLSVVILLTRPRPALVEGARTDEPPGGAPA
jgi:L-asparagine transporter-like permease